MDKMLLVRVRFLDDRYHGEGDWPPTPARLFQALVAGNAVGAELPSDCDEALGWLERVSLGPEIRAQRGRLGLPVHAFVPNNDLDAKGGDPGRISDVRVKKTTRPRHIDAKRPILYGWRFKGDVDALAAANRICSMADNLYQLGRGIDMAWAEATVVEAEQGEAVLDAAPGERYRPGGERGALALECPQRGSLLSLLQRYQSHRQRFQWVREDRKVQVHFTNPPKPRFRQVAYNATPTWRLFDLRRDVSGTPFRSWPQEQVVELVEAIRDGLKGRLIEAMPDQAEAVERFLVGRDASTLDKARRVRLIPLPSIGHEKTNRAIRRVLVMVPADCPLAVGDLEWGLSGLSLEDALARPCRLVPADDPAMLRHYAIINDMESRESHVWCSITPVALPLEAARRRIPPEDRAKQWKQGTERQGEEQRAARAVVNALRHAGIESSVESVRVQREPLSERGVRAEAFAHGDRFNKERLWHVELRFRDLMAGPMVIGDGRYLGLGVMAPVREELGVFGLKIRYGLSDGATPQQLTHALRRAVMALVQARKGPRQTLEPFFTGHASNGAPLREGDHRHLGFVADLPRERLLIIAPHVLEAREVRKDERRHLDLLNHILGDVEQLRAGAAGLLSLEPTAIDAADDPLFVESMTWETVTAYQPTRHPKKQESAAEFIADDVRAELRKRVDQEASIEVLTVDEGPRGGISARLRITFNRPETGPLILGRNRHKGGGVFAAVEPSTTRDSPHAT